MIWKKPCKNMKRHMNKKFQFIQQLRLMVENYMNMREMAKKLFYLRKK